MIPTSTYPDGKTYSFKKIATFISAAQAVGYARLKVSKPIAPFPSFLPANKIFAAAKIADTHIKAEINEFVGAVGGQIDPLFFPWYRHRQLEKLNENAYSDWLAWTLEIAQTEEALLGDLVSELFPPYTEISKRIPKGYARIHRETPVKCGHDGHSGRTDLIIDFVDDAFVWHVEVKITATESADLGKNPGYAKALENLFKKRINNFILAPSVSRDIYHLGKGDFNAVSWSQLCQRLRRWVRKRGQFSYTEFQCMMFCGFIEYNLLEICPGSFNHLDFLKNAYTD